MAVDYRLRPYWRKRRAMARPRIEPIMAMLAMFEKREGESDVEWRARLRREDDECAAEADRLEKDDP